MLKPLYLDEYVDIKTCKLRVRIWAFILKSRTILLCLLGFINDLPYKSEEMAHVAFLDERYKLTTTRRLAEMEFETLHTCKWEVSVELLWKEPLCEPRT